MGRVVDRIDLDIHLGDVAVGKPVVHLVREGIRRAFPAVVGVDEGTVGVQIDDAVRGSVDQRRGKVSGLERQIVFHHAGRRNIQGRAFIDGPGVVCGKRPVGNDFHPSIDKIAVDALAARVSEGRRRSFGESHNRCLRILNGLTWVWVL